MAETKQHARRTVFQLSEDNRYAEMTNSKKIRRLSHVDETTNTTIIREQWSHSTIKRLSNQISLSEPRYIRKQRSLEDWK